MNSFLPGVAMFQETKLYKKGQITLKNYCSFESIREKGQGGGLLTMVHENFEPVCIPIQNSSKMSENVLVVEANLGNSRARYINAYGVQESGPMSDKIDFLSILDQEIENALNNNCLICIQMDGNAKFGKQIICGDPSDISSNGQLLLVFRSEDRIVNKEQGYSNWVR